MCVVDTQIGPSGRAEPLSIGPCGGRTRGTTSAERLQTPRYADGRSRSHRGGDEVEEPYVHESGDGESTHFQ